MTSEATPTDDNSCRLCGAATAPALTATVLARHRISYQYCAACDYLQTETPYWLEEAYARPITLQDAGVLERNLLLSKRLAVTLYNNGLRSGRFLDYAGGYGVMTRLMRDIGFDFYWSDPYTQNLFACGFEARTGQTFDAISAFEYLEHLQDPVSDIRALLARTDTLILSTELRPTAVPDASWPYYGFAHGQHIGFFSPRSLAALAERVSCNLLTDGRFFHVLTRNHEFRLPPLRGFRAKLALRRLRRNMQSLLHQDARHSG